MAEPQPITKASFVLAFVEQASPYDYAHTALTWWAMYHTREVFSDEIDEDPAHV